MRLRRREEGPPQAARTCDPGQKTAMKGKAGEGGQETKRKDKRTVNPQKKAFLVVFSGQPLKRFRISLAPPLLGGARTPLLVQKAGDRGGVVIFFFFLYVFFPTLCLHYDEDGRQGV